MGITLRQAALALYRAQSTVAGWEYATGRAPAYGDRVHMQALLDHKRGNGPKPKAFHTGQLHHAA